MSQIRIVLSYEADAIRGLSDEITAEETALSCLNGSPIGAPVLASHIRTVKSSEPEIKRSSEGENTTVETALVCPINGSPICRPASISQMRIVWSKEADAARLPSVERQLE